MSWYTDAIRGETVEVPTILRQLRVGAERSRARAEGAAAAEAEAKQQAEAAAREEDAQLYAKIAPLEAEIAQLKQRMLALRLEARAQDDKRSAPHRAVEAAAAAAKVAAMEEGSIQEEATYWVRAAWRARGLTSVQVSRVLRDAYDPRLAAEGYLLSRGRNAPSRSYMGTKAGWSLAQLVRGKGAPIGVCRYMFRLAAGKHYFDPNSPLLMDSWWDSTPAVQAWHADYAIWQLRDSGRWLHYFEANSTNGSSRVRMVQGHTEALPASPAKEALLRILPGPPMRPGPTPFQMQTREGRQLYSNLTGACYRPGWG
jgi:hypothetical protein